MRRAACWLLCAGLLWVGPVAADDVSGGGDIRIPGVEPDVYDDPVIRGMLRLDAIAPFEDLAPLWDWTDLGLQRQLQASLSRLSLDDDARRHKLAVALVDLTNPDLPRVASVNGDTAMYAASLPKIAVLLASFEKIALGEMGYGRETRRLMELMMRRSDNRATTELMHQVGKQYIARVLLSPRYRLYDHNHNGGLWVGKDYASAGLWKRDPLHNLSHAATAMQVARFYYLLHTENLVTPDWSREMKQVMSGTVLAHKFVGGLRQVASRFRLLRKSGSWRTFHSDSALVERKGHSYIAVALSDHPDGGRWLARLIVELDRLIVE